MIQEVVFRDKAEINATNKVWFCFVWGLSLVGCCFCCFVLGLMLFFVEFFGG